MTEIVRRSTSRISFALMLLALSLALTAPRAAAADGVEDKTKGMTKSAAAPAAAPGIAYAAFSQAMQPQPSARPVGTLARVAAPKAVAGKTPATMPLPPRQPAVSTAPLTPGEKFHIFVKKSFLSYSPWALSVLGGVVGEITDKDHGRHMSAGDFIADSGTHMARSMAFRATANFLEKFAFATILRQDPRYHRSDKKSVGGKIGYAVSRVFITQGDRCGCDQFNASFLMGGLTASAIAQTWRRPEDQTTAKIFTGWASHIGIRAFTNILSEFIGGQ
ncbi:MAG TPA: hypothetical protein VKA60_25470 [Blastocatellia bacterium]|nr:hypothetical protein [Blastocatellia bacterium]